jgi:3-deoxy-7-phosphoheptulonate synthase/chorismate mutase
MSDPLIESIRAEISALDREVLEAFNRRLELVARLRRHKDALGLDFHDPDRERRMLDELLAANTGPLSEEGVGALLQSLLDLTKREV